MQPFTLSPLKLEMNRTDGSSDLQTLHQSICALAEEMFKDEGMHPPSWYVLFPSGHILGVVTPWENDAEQMASKNAICATVHGVKAVAYSFVSECFMTVIHGTKDMTEEELMAKRNAMPNRLEDLPESERDEVLMVTTHAADHSYRMTKWLINSKGKKPFLGPQVDEDVTTHDKLKGRMFDLFAQTPRIPKGMKTYDEFMAEKLKTRGQA